LIALVEMFKTDEAAIPVAWFGEVDKGDILCGYSNCRTPRDLMVSLLELIIESTAISGKMRQRFLGVCGTCSRQGKGENSHGHSHN